MNKKTFNNKMSIEKKDFQSKVAKYRRLLNNGEECENVPSFKEKTLLEEILEVVKRIDGRICKVEERISELEKNMVDKGEVLAQNATTRECKVILNAVHRSVGRMGGEIIDSEIIKIAAEMPINNMLSLNDIEEKLIKSNYAASMTSYIYKLKGCSHDVAEILKKIFADDLLFHFNWEGRFNKRPFSALKLVSEIIYDVFRSNGRIEFEKDIKKAIELSHNRTKQRSLYKKRRMGQNTTSTTTTSTSLRFTTRPNNFISSTASFATTHPTTTATTISNARYTDSIPNYHQIPSPNESILGD